jgi:RecA-family ATPase
MLQNLKNILHQVIPGRRSNRIAGTVPVQSNPPLKAIGLSDFLSINVTPRQMLLSPILPERSLATLYAPRGLGKSWLALSIGLSVAAGRSVLRWSAPRHRNVLYIDGEMPIVALQERLKAISIAMGTAIPNDGFRILAADNVEGGINLGMEDGQYALEPLVNNLDLLILDNLSTLCTSRSESASDAWVPMQNWLLKLRRRGVSVLLVHHAGTNGRQRGKPRKLPRQTISQSWFNDFHRAERAAS